MAMVQFLTKAKDVAAFAKNAGPQALRVDYLTADGRRSTYTPDFIVRDAGGTYYIAETKGRADAEVAAKARAAVEWCKAASAADKKAKWDYLYVPEKVFEGASGVSLDELARTCRPSLSLLLKQATEAQQTLKLEVAEEDKVAEQVKGFVDPAVLAALPSRYRKAIADAAAVFHFFEKKEGASLGACFQPLLGPIDHAAEALMRSRLEAGVPTAAAAQRVYFEPDFSTLQKTQAAYMKDKGGLLRKLLVHRAPLMPTGVLLFCLDYATKPDEGLPGVFTAVRTQFAPLAKSEMPKLVKAYYDFRNNYIAHAKADLTDRAKAREALALWVRTLLALHEAVGGTP
jgi:type III restriction enzyme